MHRRPIAIVGLLLLLLTGLSLAPGRALAAWSSSGNAIANTTNLDEIEPVASSRRNVQWLASDMRGGLVSMWRRDFSVGTDSVRLQRLDGTGARAWNGTAGVAVGPAADVGMVSDGDGGVWTVTNSGGSPAGLYVQHFDTDGVPQFAGAGVRASSESWVGDNPAQIALTPGGSVLVASIGTAGSSNVDSIYVQRVSPAGALAFGPRGLRASVHGGVSIQGGIWKLFADGEGAVVVWATTFGNAQERSIGAQRISAAGDTLWGPDGVNVFAGVGVGEAIDASATWSATTGLTVAFTRLGTTNDVCAARLDPSGHHQWGTAASPLVVTPTASFASFPEPSVGIVPDASTGAIIGWEDVDGRIRAQRLNASGVKQWVAQGVVVHDDGMIQDQVRMCTDDAGGAYFVHHEDTATDDGAWVVRLDGTGAPLWTRPVNGTVNDLTGNERHPICMPDGTGGVLLAWEDDRDSANPSNPTDVFGRHLDASGNAFVATLAVTFPNGGETFQGLEPTTVTWTSNVAGRVDLAYSLNNGALVAIASNLANDGSYVWTVPNLTTSVAKLHVTLAGSTLTDASDAFFSICPTLSVTATMPTVTTAPRELARADFNEDGIQDLVVGTSAGVAVMLGGGSGGIGNGTFPTVVNYAVPSAVNDVAVADFNEDGILDLMVSTGPGLYRLNGLGASGTGNGTFGAASAIAGTSGGRGLAVADLDADGIQDVVVCENTGNVVSVLIGDGTNGKGSGGFASKTSFAVGAAPVSVAIGHLNADYVPDLVVAESGNSSVGVLLGQAHSELSGSGSFAPVVHYTTLTTPQSVVLADFDGDGPLDVAVGCTGTTLGISVLLGNGAGAFGNGTLAAKADIKPSLDAADLAVADLDRDGVPDLVATNPTGSVQLHFGDGDGTFSPGGALSVGTSPLGVVVGDWDENGRCDLAVANTGTNTVSILRAGCSGGASTSVAVSSPNGGVTWEIGRTATASWSAGTGVFAVDVELSRDNGRNYEPLVRQFPGTSLALPVTPGPSDSVFVRVTNSVLPSSTDASNSRNTICLGIGGVSSFSTAAGGPDDMVAADFDGDGILDLAMAVTGGVSVKRGLGTAGAGDGTFGADTLYATGADPVRLATADFNDDGRADLVATRAGGVAVLLANPAPSAGNLFLPFAFMPAGAAPVGVAVSDFNEDGIRDFVVTVPAVDSTYTFIGQGAGGVGSGAFTNQGRRVHGDAPTSVIVGDFKEDGIADVLVGSASAAAPAIVLRPGNGAGGLGNGGFSGPFTYPVSATVLDLAAGDFDEDGILDVAVLTTSGLSIMDGAGTAGVGDGGFAGEREIDTFSNGKRLLVGDWNRDGRLDVVVTLGVGLSAGTYWFIGAGTGTTGNGEFLDPVSQNILVVPGPLVAGDFLEDGETELMVGVPASSMVVRYDGNCPAPSGALTLTAPNGLDLWQTGTARTVTWTQPSTTPAVHIEVSRDDGATWERLASGVSGGTYDWNVVAPTSHAARMRVVDAQLQNRLDGSDQVFNIVVTTTDADDAGLPAVPALMLSGANPAVGAVRVLLSLPAGRDVDVDVYDAGGRRVRSLAHGPFAAGRHGLQWDGRDSGGGATSPGVYFVKVRAGAFEATRRVVRVR